MVVLLARLAHHILLWSKSWLSQVPTTRRRLHGYGLVQLLQEGTTVPGVIRWRRGWMVSVHFDPLHPLAEALQQGFEALFRGVSGWVFALKLAAGGGLHRQRWEPVPHSRPSFPQPHDAAS